MNDGTGDFEKSLYLKNHRERRGHREKYHCSVLSVYSAVDYPVWESLMVDKTKIRDWRKYGLS